MRLKPYTEYKNSGMAWLGRVPSHWDILPNRALFAERIERNAPDEDMLTVTIARGVLQQSEFLAGSPKRDSSNVDKSNYKLVLPNDFVYNKMRMWQGAVGASRHRGIVSPAYIVLKPRRDINSWYFHFLMRTPDYIAESYRNSYGICDDQLSLRYEDFKTIKTPVPPRDEQDAIVVFLNSKLAPISQFIHGKQRLIELLQEKQQAVVNQAITRGSDQDVGLRPSGIIWLGDIPEHWEVKRLRTLATVKPSGVDKNSVKGEQPVSLCNYVDVYRNEFITEEIDFMQATASQGEVLAFELKAGDVIITKDSESWEDIGVPAFVPETLPGVVCGYHLALVRRRSESVDGEFLFRAISSDALAHQFRISANGVTRYGLAQGAIKGVFVPVPPREEQRKVAEIISERNSKTAAAISRAQREIQIMNEYRIRLIADMVTGRLDVRTIPVAACQNEVVRSTVEPQQAEQVLDVGDDCAGSN